MEDMSKTPVSKSKWKFTENKMTCDAACWLKWATRFNSEISLNAAASILKLNFHTHTYTYAHICNTPAKISIIAFEVFTSRQLDLRSARRSNSLRQPDWARREMSSLCVACRSNTKSCAKMMRHTHTNTHMQTNSWQGEQLNVVDINKSDNNNTDSYNNYS